MLFRAFVILGSCLVVGCQAESLQKKNLRLSVRTAHTLTNGKEKDAPDPRTRHRRLQRHDTLPVAPIESPTAATVTPVLPPSPEPSIVPLSSLSSAPSPSPSPRTVPSSVPTTLPAGAPTSRAPSRRPSPSPSKFPSSVPPTLSTDMPTIAAPSRRPSSVLSPPSNSPSSDTATAITEAPAAQVPSTQPPTPSTGQPSIIHLSNFNLVVTSDGVTVDQPQLTTTLEGYLTAGMMQVSPSARTVLLAIPRQLEKGTAIQYTGIVVISTATLPSTQKVQALEEELLRDLSAVQAAVDANSAIGLNVRVEQVVAASSSAVALSEVTVVLTSDDTDVVDQSQLTTTLEDYRTAGLIQVYPNAVAVVLNGIQRQLEGSTAVDYNGYVIFSDATPPAFQEVQVLEEVLLLNLSGLQAAVDGNPVVGQNVRVEELVAKNNSVVAFSPFTTFLSSDDASALDEAQLVMTLKDVLMALMLEDYANTGYVTLAGIPRQLEGSTAVVFTGYVVFTDATPPVFQEVQATEEKVLLDLMVVQATVNGNSAIGQNVRVEQVVAGSSSTVALSRFTTFLTSDNDGPVDQDQLAMTLEDYLKAGIMEEYPNTGTVTLFGAPELEGTTAVYYSGYVILTDATLPAFVDVQDMEEDLLLDLSAVQAAVDGNPAVAGNVRVEAVAAKNNSAVALSSFTTVLTSDDADVVDGSQLTVTLKNYLTVGMMQVYSSVGSVTLDGIQRQVDQDDLVDYTGYVIFNDAVPPPYLSIQYLGKVLLLDASALQSAVDGNPAIGNNPLVAEVNFDEPGSEVLPTGPFIALSGFTVVVTSDDDNDAVDEVQLTRTLLDYLMAGITQIYPNAWAFALDGRQRQMDHCNGVDYIGFLVFLDSPDMAPPVMDVQALEEELLFKLSSVQAAVDGNAAIGQNVRVEQVIVDDKSAVALTMFDFVVTSDVYNAVNEDQLTTTLKDFLTTGMMQVDPSAIAVMLDGAQRELEGSSSVAYTGHAIFSDVALLPTFQKVQTLEQKLIYNVTAVQAAVDGNPAIGKNVRVEEVVAGDNSVVALSGFSMVITPDSDDPIDKDQLTETIAEYLLAGLMQDYPDAESVILQSQRQQGDKLAFSGYAVFPNTMPGFRDVQELERRLMRNTSAVQTAVDSNRAISQNARVARIAFDDPDDNEDDKNTAVIIGVVVGCSAFLLALIALVLTHHRRNAPSSPPPPPTEVRSTDRNTVSPVVALASAEGSQVAPPAEVKNIDENTISPVVASTATDESQIPPPAGVKNDDGNVAPAPPEASQMPPPVEVKSNYENATPTPPEGSQTPPPTEVKSNDGNVSPAPPEESQMPLPTEVKSVDGNTISPAFAPIPATAAEQFATTEVVFLGEVDEVE